MPARIRRRNGLTRQDKTAPKFPDLVKRDFTADSPNSKWVGDMTEIPTAAGKLYLATVIDLFSRQAARRGDRAAPRRRAGLPGHPDGCRGPRRGRHHRRGDLPQRPGSTYTAGTFTALCRKLRIRQSMGRVGSCFDNACAEAFFSSLEWEVLSRHDFENTRQAQAVVIEWCYGFYNHQRRHSAAGMQSPNNYENTADSFWEPLAKPHEPTVAQKKRAQGDP